MVDCMLDHDDFLPGYHESSTVYSYITFEMAGFILDVEVLKFNHVQKFHGHSQENHEGTISLYSSLLGYICSSLGSPLPSASRRLSNDPNNGTVTDPMYQLSTDPDFHFEILRVLGFASFEGSDIGEVLVMANKIKYGDMESFHDASYTIAT